MSERAVATLTIHDAAAMTPSGRRAVATWLKRQAAALQRDGRRYAKRFTARYLTR